MKITAGSHKFYEFSCKVCGDTVYMLAKQSLPAYVDESIHNIKKQGPVGVWQHG